MSVKVLIQIAIVLMLLVLPVSGQQTAEDWYAKGDLQIDDNPEESLQAYNNAHEIDPQNVTYLTAKGMALDILDRYDEAVQAYDEILKMYPNYYPTLDDRAYSLYQAKKYDEALVTLDKAIAINPEDYLAWGYRADILYDMGRYADSDSADAELQRLHNRVDYTTTPSEYDISRIKEWYNMGIPTYQIASDIDHHTSTVDEEVEHMIAQGELTRQK